MARTKFDSAHLVTVSDCIDRMKAISGVKTDTDLALAMGRERNTVGNWRLEGRNIPPEFVIDFCQKYSYSVEYVLFGITQNKETPQNEENFSQIEIIPDPTGGIIVGSISNDSGYKKLTPEGRSDLLNMTAEILDSDTVYRPALVSNIRAFHHGIIGEKEMGDMRDEVKAVRQDIARLETLILTINNAYKEKKTKEV